MALQELEGNGAAGPNKGKSIKSGKTWKRNTGKENSKKLDYMAGEQGYKAGIKRTGKLIDESEEEVLEDRMVQGKKQKTSQNFSSAKVVKASLNWPQTDQ